VPGRLGILVVDDEAPVRNLLKVVLQTNGLTPWLAANGPEAANIYRQHQEEIAFVMLEMSMREWDGPRTLNELREINPSVRACFMSTGLDYVQEQALTRVFAKPFRVEEVCRFLKDAVGIADQASLVPSKDGAILEPALPLPC